MMRSDRLRAYAVNVSNVPVSSASTYWSYTAVASVKTSCSVIAVSNRAFVMRCAHS